MYSDIIGTQEGLNGLRIIWIRQFFLFQFLASPGIGEVI